MLHRPVGEGPGAFGRRRALALLGGGAAALVAGCALGTASPPGGRELGPSGQPLVEPAVVDSRGGRLTIELVAAPGARLGTSAVRVLGYNGTSPGPTLRVRPGDELAIRLVNRLDEPTNLHTHGLHVSPEDHADNPFLRVDPGASLDYRMRLPDDHPTGTFWYHPHHHGLVADQLFAGLVGAIVVVRDDEPTAPVERLLVVTDIGLDGDGAVTTVGPPERMAGRLGSEVLVDGLVRPGLAGTPGRTQRWRIVNACTSRFVPLRLDGHTLEQIALDGRSLPATARHDRLLLAAGNRADVLVTPVGVGTFPLVAEAFDRGAVGMGGMGMGPDATGTGGRTEEVVLADLVVAGPPRPATVDLRVRPAPVPAGPVVRRRALTYGMGMGSADTAGAGMGMAFTIDGRTFDPERDDQVVRAGDVEEWVVVNPTAMVHSFHLHVWPFTVVDTSDGAGPGPGPQDVVVVPARGWVRLRIPFSGITGRSVYHCHVLDHEDAGMMGTVRVVS